MKTTSWVVDDYDNSPTLKTCEIAPSSSRDLLVKVTATGLNFADLLMIKGTYQDTPEPPFVPGMEIAGIVQQSPSGVEGLSPGTRVMATVRSGGLASHAYVPADAIRLVPDTMDDVTAAGFQIAYGTSHLALTRRAAINPGETLAVLGASGGVGLTAVEIGHRLGARVVAVARGSEKLEVARAAGAELLIDSGAGDLRAALSAVGPIDVVYDAVGGEAGETALRVLAPEGRFLVIGFASGTLPTLRANHLLVKNQTVIGFYWGGYAKFRPDAVSDSLAELTRWHAAGQIKPHIGKVLPLEDALEGLEMLRARKATGKIVITQ